MGMESAWLIPTLCAGAFAAIAMFGRRLPGQGSFLAIIAIAAGFVVFWPVTIDLIRNGPASFDRVWFETGDLTIRLSMTIDQLTIIMVGLATAVSLAVQVYSIGYLHGDPRFGWYLGLHSLFAASMIALVLANNLLLFYVAWELVGVCSYLLIGFWYERRAAAEAAKKAFITTRVGDVALLIGILLLFKATGSFQITEVLRAVEEGHIAQSTLNWSALLLFLGAAGKSAQFPFHVWLPDAMEGPTPVSALIHAATMVAAGVYLVARMSPLFEAAPSMLLVVSAIGLITAFIGASLAMVQHDIKKVLAYSTISQLGLMMLALGSTGFTAGIFHLLAHGFFKALLFLGAGSVIHGMHNDQDMRAMGGLQKKMPRTFSLFVVGSLGLIGVFPFSGFFSKDEILLSVLKEWGLIWVLLTQVVVGMTALYMMRLLMMTFTGKPRSEEANQAHESPYVMILPMAALAIPAIFLGLLALPWTESYRGFGTFLFFAHGPHEFEMNLRVAIGATVVAVGMMALGWRLYGNEGFKVRRVDGRFPHLYAVLQNGFYLDAAYQWTVDKVVLGIAKIVANFDKVVVNEGGVDGSGKLTALSGKILRYHETGLVGNYVLVVALSALVIIVFAVFLR